MRLMWCATALFWWCGTGTAVPLHPYNTSPLHGTTVLNRPELAGQVLATATRSFELIPAPGFIAPPYAGTVDERVVREYGTGTLTFYYQVHLDAGSEPAMPAFSVEYFSQVRTDVDFLSDSSGVGDIGISARHLGYRTLVSFFIGQPSAPGPPILPGESSHMFFIRTDARSFGPGGLIFVDYDSPGAVGAVVASAFQPVPEPATMFATTLALCAVLVMRKSRIPHRTKCGCCRCRPDTSHAT